MGSRGVTERWGGGVSGSVFGRGGVTRLTLFVTVGVSWRSMSYIKDLLEGWTSINFSRIYLLVVLRMERLVSLPFPLFPLFRRFSLLLCDSSREANEITIDGEIGIYLGPQYTVQTVLPRIEIKID